MGCRTIVLNLMFMVVSMLPLSPEARSEARVARNGAPVFAKKTIELGGRKVVVEIADDDEKRAYGLMNRDQLSKDEGMLFIFDEAERRSFWMKNTRIPLSIAYFDKGRVLREIIDMRPDPITAIHNKTYPSHTEAQYALEMNIGWFERNKIRPGVSFRFADTKVRTH